MSLQFQTGGNRQGCTACCVWPCQCHTFVEPNQFQYRLAFMVVVDAHGSFAGASHAAMLDRYREALERVVVSDLVALAEPPAVERMSPVGEVWQ